MTTGGQRSRQKCNRWKVLGQESTWHVLERQTACLGWSEQGPEQQELRPERGTTGKMSSCTRHCRQCQASHSIWCLLGWFRHSEWWAKRTLGSIKLSSSGHIQALHGHLHRICICLYSTDHIYWIIFIVKLYYYCPADGHFMIYSLPYFFPPLNIIDPEGVLNQKWIMEQKETACQEIL